MKGVPFSMEGIRKGYLFYQKMVYKRVKDWTSGRNLPVQNFIECPPDLLFYIFRRYTLPSAQSFTRVNHRHNFVETRKTFSVSKIVHVPIVRSPRVSLVSSFNVKTNAVVMLYLRHLRGANCCYK